MYPHVSVTKLGYMQTRKYPVSTYLFLNQDKCKPEGIRESGAKLG